MAESAIEKIMRLKREREASGAAGADSTVKPETPKVQETQETPTPTPMEVLQASEPAEPEPQKVQAPLSAMERLRQLKMGSSASEEPKETQKEIPKEEPKNETIPSSVSANGDSGSSSSVHSVSPNLKEPKTHPIAMEMAELEAALDAEVPGFVNILSAIHKKLRLDPNCVTLLDDEEIGVIVAGLEKHTNVTIVSPNAVKAAKKAAKVPVSASDL